MTTPAASSTALHDRVAHSFARQGMLRHVGAQLRRVEPGLVELWLPYSDQVTQQQGTFHGGAIGVLADVACGYAAMTVAPEGMEIVTAEYKINFLGGHQGGGLRAIGRVVKPGKRLIVASAEVTHLGDDGQESACALIQATLVPVPAR